MLPCFNDSQTLKCWKAWAKDLEPEFAEVLNQLLTAIASSVGVERIFSSFQCIQLIHLKLRNHLGSWQTSVSGCFFPQCVNKKLGVRRQDLLVLNPEGHGDQK